MNHMKRFLYLFLTKPMGVQRKMIKGVGTPQIVVVAVAAAAADDDLVFTTLFTSQVISVAFYSERQSPTNLAQRL